VSVRALWPAVLGLALAGCGAAGQQNVGGGGTGARTPGQISPISSFQAHPQAVDPSSSSAPAAGIGSGAPSGGVSVQTPSSGVLAQPISLAQVRAQLAASGITANNGRATLTPLGLALAPLSAPVQVQEVIAAGNEIARLPYRFGGGHGTFIDNAYDCSGSLSFVFAAAGLLNTTMTSGQLESWGKPGPGKWITVFATAGHTFMYIAGLRFDTVALAETGSRWSNRSANESNLGAFVIRHPAGL
jgi:hypothetical protein